MKQRIQQLVDSQRVTSAPRKLNWRDWIVAKFWTGIGIIGTIAVTFFDASKEIVANSSETLIPFLKAAIKPDGPLWSGVALSLVVGIVILVARKRMGPKED